MKIGLFGYGKMGKAIEQIAVARGHQIVFVQSGDFTTGNFDEVDVAIDFSLPSSAFDNIKKALEAKVPIVSGTTGWLDDYDRAVTICKENDGGFVYSSNFSLGVNIFFKLNEYLAQMMNKFQQYQPSITEIHHTQKIDAPSGTAITLAEQIVAQTTIDGWVLAQDKNNTLKINALREGTVPGTHIIGYDSEIDSIQIKHVAHSREGFALGAVVASEWIVNKKGVFTMKDVLGL
ncbi:MAG: 4-hydroxy-tetrahydrodipicolinate reductase [Bacteroidota bacterium]|nr:4-hydroxy-tetrahydrodipicolinate reductase [Bacteroidota bacterium]